MEVYYRGRCRAIAIIDIIWSSIGVCSAILTFFWIALLAQGKQTDATGFRNARFEFREEAEDQQSISPQALRTSPGKNEVHMFANVMLGMVMLLLMMNIVQLLAAVRLLKACDPETDTHKALRYCRFWSGVTVFFVVFIGLNLFSTGGRPTFPGQLFSMGQILFRALGLYYVSEFIKGLVHPILPIIIGESFMQATDGLDNGSIPENIFSGKANQPPPYPKEDIPPPYQEAPPPYTEINLPITEINLPIAEINLPIAEISDQTITTSTDTTSTTTTTTITDTSTIDSTIPQVDGEVIEQKI